MKLPPRLAKWLRVRRREHERHVAEHMRTMSQLDVRPMRRRGLRVPPPPGGRQQDRGKSPHEHGPRYHGKPLPPPRDSLAGADRLQAAVGAQDAESVDGEEATP